MNGYIKKFGLLILFSLFGLYWFSIFVRSSEPDVPDFLMATYLFLPGVSLPMIVILVHKLKDFSYSLLYIFLSWLTYFGAFWTFGSERIWAGYPYVASFLGAMIFILITTRFVDHKYNFKMSVVGAIISTVAFTTRKMLDSELSFSISFFLWTFFVGLILNLTLKGELDKR